MKLYRVLLAAAMVLTVGAVGHAAPKFKIKNTPQFEWTAQHTVARQWNEALLDAIRIDPSMTGVLIQHLEDIADKAKAAGLNALAERSERLKERLESR